MVRNFLDGTYNTLCRLALPFVLGRIGLKGIRSPEYLQRVPERFGLTPFLFSREDRPIWIHAVSVGEVRAALPLITTLKDMHPDLALLVTTTTPTGSRVLKQSLADTVQHCYLPYDLKAMSGRFLRRTNPALALFMETEIWPNLYTHCAEQNTPIILANARISSRSFNGYKKIASFIGGVLNKCAWILTQSDADTERFLELGVAPDKVVRTGNIKFDQQVPEEQILSGKTLRAAIGRNRPVWIAASTHAGEDEAAFTAHAQLLEHRPDSLLILEPRHPERFAAAREMAIGNGFSVQAHSEAQPVKPGTTVYLGDCMGRMFTFYAASDVAFVGGSLVKTGGHNLLEPAALGLPVLSGPNLFNFKEISRMLLEQHGLQLVSSPEELGRSLFTLFQHPDEAQKMGEAAKRVVDGNKGATQRIFKTIEPFLNR